MLGNRTQSLIGESYDDVSHWEIFLQTLFSDEQIKVTDLQAETVEVNYTEKYKIREVWINPKAKVIPNSFRDPLIF